MVGKIMFGVAVVAILLGLCVALVRHHLAYENRDRKDK